MNTSSYTFLKSWCSSLLTVGGARSFLFCYSGDMLISFFVMFILPEFVFGIVLVGVILALSFHFDDELVCCMCV